MEQEPAVAFEQHDPAFAALPARRRNAERTRQAVADRAEFWAVGARAISSKPALNYFRIKLGGEYAETGICIHQPIFVCHFAGGGAFRRTEGLCIASRVDGPSGGWTRV
jgi:hypothetical protein